MVHSVLAVESVGKVTRDLGREEKLFERMRAVYNRNGASAYGKTGGRKNS